jgi:hypothetical protein
MRIATMLNNKVEQIHMYMAIYPKAYILLYLPLFRF